MLGRLPTTFLYDGNNLVGEYDASGNILARYVFGPGVDDPILWYQGAGSAGRNWLHMDNQNSAVAWSNASGALVGARGYGPYGERKRPVKAACRARRRRVKCPLV